VGLLREFCRGGARPKKTARRGFPSAGLSEIRVQKHWVQEDTFGAFGVGDFRRVRGVAFAGFFSSLMTSQSNRMAAITIFASPECTFFSSFLKDAETDFSGAGRLLFLVMVGFLSSGVWGHTRHRRDLPETCVKVFRGRLALRSASSLGVFKGAVFFDFYQSPNTVQMRLG